MVKVVGIETDKFEHGTIEEIYEYFKDEEFVETDCESFGFDVYTKDLMCIQLGNAVNQFVIHPSLLHKLKALLEEKTLIGHAIKFDLQFLYHNNIWPNKVYDTFLAEGVLFCGIPQHRKGLAFVARNRLGIDLDKSVRDKIWEKGLTTEVIQYAADDVKHLTAIKNSQAVEIAQKGVRFTVELENQFVLVLAYIEYCGFKLDADRWKRKMASDLQKFTDARDRLDNYVRDNGYSAFIEPQGDLFCDIQATTINWASPKQVIKFFKELGIPTEIEEKGEKKDTAEAKHLKQYEKEFPILEPYLEYKGYEKVVSTYGQSFINQINPVTGKLHTRFTQIMNTGRISSGGKVKETKEAYSNFQNIPKDEETRSCFIPDKGNVLVVSDYSGQEAVILANKSMEPNLLEFYDNGLSDMHCFVAQKMYPELVGLSVAEIKEHHGDKRYAAKTVGFTLAYGGNGLTIAQNMGCEVEMGYQIEASYFEGFPGLKPYFESQTQETLKNGYITTDNIMGRKCYIPEFGDYKRIEGKFDKAYWEKYKALRERFNAGKEKDPEHKDYEFFAMKKEVSTYFSIKGQIQRNSANYTIQSPAAGMTKIAGIYIFKWIKENNLLNIVKFPNIVHDETVLECPEALSEATKNAAKECMERAALVYCKRVKVKADPLIATVWMK